VFTQYNVSPIALALLAVYMASFALYKTRRIKIATHRKVWNVLLLATFLFTALFGFVLAIRRDYALIFPFPVNMLLWHVEAGIVMTVISVFHVSWHLSYYRELFRSGREKLNAAQELERTRDTDDTRRNPAVDPDHLCAFPPRTLGP
jgi:hypothetical protein